jgi:hypothetical protein
LGSIRIPNAPRKEGDKQRGAVTLAGEGGRGAEDEKKKEKTTQHHPWTTAAPVAHAALQISGSQLGKRGQQL